MKSLRQMPLKNSIIWKGGGRGNRNGKSTLAPRLSHFVSRGDDTYIEAQMTAVAMRAPMNETFRLRKSVKYQGVAFSAIFLAFLIGCLSIFFLEDPAKHGFEHSVAISGGMGLVVSGVILCMSLYTWAAYYVERFTVDGTTLSIRSMLQDRQFNAYELRRVIWRARPFGGSIVFHAFGSKARLDLHGYARDDRLRIIRAVYDLVPRSIQEQWPEFCHRIALPLRDDRPALARIDPTAELYLITRKRYDWMAAFALPSSIIAACAIWAFLNWQQFFALPFLVIAAWLLLRFSVPREGDTQLHLASTADGRGVLIGCGGMVSGLLAMIALPLLGMETSMACGAACMVMVPAFLCMLYLLYKSDMQRRSVVEQAFKGAAELWERREASPSSP